MYSLLFGSCAAFLIGYTYALLFTYTQNMYIFKKNMLIKAGIFIGRILFLMYFGNIILKIYHLPLILFIPIFFIAYTLTIYSLQRNV